MKVIHSSFSFPFPQQFDSALQQIEYCARISHRTEDQLDSSKTEDFIRRVVVDRGDWSVTEHSSVTVLWTLSRSITHQLVRHRLFSYTQESQRFVNYAKKLDLSFVYPYPDIVCEHCVTNPHPTQTILPTGEIYYIHSNNKKCMYDALWRKNCEDSEKEYMRLIENKWRPQEARSVLPNCTATTLAMTGNLRSWRHLFGLRTTINTEPPARDAVIQCMNEFKNKIPVLFDDIEPNARQIDNIRKGC